MTWKDKIVPNEIPGIREKIGGVGISLMTNWNVRKLKCHTGY